MPQIVGPKSLLRTVPYALLEVDAAIANKRARPVVP